MSPREHDLSQKVLEFLIAQQDWFMLDIPPPPSHPEAIHLAPINAHAEEDLSVHPSSDEGDDTSIAGGWKLVGRQTKRITRRRTHGALGF